MRINTDKKSVKKETRKYIKIYCTAEEHERLKAEAREKNVSISKYALDLTLQRADPYLTLNPAALQKIVAYHKTLDRWLAVESYKIYHIMYIKNELAKITNLLESIKTTAPENNAYGIDPVLKSRINDLTKQIRDIIDRYIPTP